MKSHPLLARLSGVLMFALAALAPSAFGATLTVLMNNFTFNPAVVNITAGDTVTWVNQGGSHTATGTGTDPICGTGTIPVSQSVTFNTVGTFPYVCITPGHAASGMVGSVVVAANVPPTVSITTPTNGQVFIAPASFTITADVADSDGTIQAVIFNTNGVGVDVVMFPPFQKTLSNLPVGTYALTAVAIDSGNLNTTSAVVTITVQVPNLPPTVSFNSPTNGTKVLAGSNPTLDVTAGDADGTVARVDYFASPTAGVIGDTIGFTTTAPFQFVVNSVPAGTFFLTAVATDQLGATNASSAVQIFSLTNATLVPAFPLLSAPAFTVSNSFSGQEYFVDALTNFSGPLSTRWFPIATNTAPSNNFIFTDPVLTAPIPRLYRVRQSL